MSTPYYQDEHITLYLGSYEDHLTSVGKVDCIVTDPPYGETSLAWDRWPLMWPVLVEVHAVTNSMWTFGSMRMFLERTQDFRDWRMSQDVVWEKERRTGIATDRFARVHEHAVHWYTGPWGEVYTDTPKVAHHGRRIPGTVNRSRVDPSVYGAINTASWQDDGTRWHPSVIHAPATPSAVAINPTEKPLAVLTPLITYACPPGGTVLDLFAGSGSTLVAARNAGRHAIGVELREDQAEATANRLSQSTFDLAGLL